MVLRLGLVGRGRWGQNIERTLLSFPDIALSVIAKGESPPDGLDGVLIATPGAVHAEAALPYLEKGIPTFIEKPMATTVGDAERIRAAALKSGAAVFVGHIYLYHPAFVAALELVPQLGVIHYVSCEGANDRPRRDSSVLWDWLPHDLSMARAIFGREPNRVAAWSLSGASMSQAALSKFDYDDSVLISTASRISPLRRRQTTIVGEQATLVFDDKAPRALTFCNRQTGEIHYPDYGSDLPLTVELAAFLRLVRSGERDSSQTDMGIGVVRAIAAAEKSVTLGGSTVTIQ